MKVELTEHAVAQARELGLSVQEVQGLARCSAPYTSVHGPWNSRNGEHLFDVETYGHTKVVQQVGRFAAPPTTAEDFLRGAARHLRALLDDILEEGPEADTDAAEAFLDDLINHLGE